MAEKGGEALANTAWSVLTPGGDVVKESIGAFPRVILAEGEYRAIARNEGKVFEREFKVVTGVDGDVEVRARYGALHRAYIRLGTEQIRWFALVMVTQSLPMQSEYFYRISTRKRSRFCSMSTAR